MIGRKPKPCPSGQHRPERPKPIGYRLPTCRRCGWAYM